MKKLCLALALCTCLGANAQISVGSSVYPGIKANKISETNLNKFKSTTTLITLQEKDYNHLEDFEKAIAGVWKITKFKIIKPEEVPQYELRDGYSFFTFGSFQTSYTSVVGKSAMREYVQNLTYDLYIPIKEEEEGKVTGRRYFSRMLLSLDEDGVNMTSPDYMPKNEEEARTFMYKKAVFPNWGAGFLQGQLTVINNTLMAGETRDLITRDMQKELLAPLKNDTLYVPANINLRYSALSGQSRVVDNNKSNILKSYLYPIKVLDMEEINKMILNRTKPIYYLVFLKTRIDKYVNVYHTENGIVYTDHHIQSFNFKKKDLSRIAKAIRK